MRRASITSREWGSSVKMVNIRGMLFLLMTSGDWSIVIGLQGDWSVKRSVKFRKKYLYHYFLVLITSLETYKLNIILIIITCYSSTPCLIDNNSQRCEPFHLLQASPHPSHLTQPHPHAVRCKVIVICNCQLVPYWRELLRVSWSQTRNLDLPFANT